MAGVVESESEPEVLLMCRSSIVDWIDNTNTTSLGCNLYEIPERDGLKLCRFNGSFILVLSERVVLWVGRRQVLTYKLSDRNCG